MDFEQVRRYTEQDVIEMIPLAYMRGRTLNEAFIILDEAQNTTVAQMKMFLTPHGNWIENRRLRRYDTSRPAGHTRSGLVDAIGRLRDIMVFVKSVDRGGYRPASVGAGHRCGPHLRR